MGRSLARLGVALGVALLVLLGVLLAVLPSPGEERYHSVFATGEHGMRALYLTLERLGFSVRPWSEAPGHLEGPGTLLVLAETPAAPPALPPAPAGRDPEHGAGPNRSRDLAHYQRFVSEGGTLLVLDAGEDELAFLRDSLALPELASLTCEGTAVRDGDRVSAGRGRWIPEPRRTQATPDDVEESVLMTFSNGEGIALRDGPVARYEGVGEHEILARDERGGAIFVQRASGAGRVALLALPVAPLENAELAKRSGPAVFFVRVLEALRASGAAPIERVLFDEYALGGWRPAPVAELAFSPRLAWLSVHLLLLLLVYCWRSAWTGPFPRDPEAYLAASPLARARGFGNLLARASRSVVLARLLRRGVLQRREARTGQRGPPGSDDALAARLAALARGDERRHARLVELFQTSAPRDRAELEALADGLAALERELAPAAEPGKGRRTLGARPARSGSSRP